MTGLQRWRKVAKTLVIISFTWEAAVATASLVLILVAVRDGAAPSLDRLIPFVATLGTFGVMIWAIRDARKRRDLRLPGQVATSHEDA